METMGRRYSPALQCEVCGVVWCGVVCSIWCGVWYGVCGMSYGVVNGVVYDVRYGVACVVWCGVCGMLWCVWYGVVCVSKVWCVMCLLELFVLATSQVINIKANTNL